MRPYRMEFPRLTLRVLATLALLALPGCAATSVPWQNPSVPKDKWSGDWTACRRYGEAQVGFREGDSQQFRDYDRARAKKQADALAAACMRDKGYFPARSK
jgi:hypothetical protein